MIGDKKSQDLLKPGYIIKEKWFVIKKIGGGGFGEIYEGVDITAKSVKNHGINYCNSCYSQESISNTPSFRSDSGIADCPASSTVSKATSNKKSDDSNTEKKFLGSNVCISCGKELKVKRNHKVAIKVESIDKLRQVMKMEVAVLKKLIGKENVCNILGSGKNSFVNYVVMTLQGMNIAELRRGLAKNSFSKQTTFRVIRQCLKGIRSVHEAGYLHRDIKPSNFALHSSIRGYICILDFGLARPYLFQQSDGVDVIRPPRDIAGFRGTIRYASKNAHNQKDLGRFDDLWSLSYTMIECLDNALPWRKLREKEEVGKMKNKINHFELAIKLGMPEDLARSWFSYLSSLSYFSAPDYEFLDNLLKYWLDDNKITDSHPFDWELDDGLAKKVTNATQDDQVNIEVKHADVNNEGKTPVIQPRRRQMNYQMQKKSSLKNGKLTNNNSTEFTQARHDSVDGQVSTIQNIISNNYKPCLNDTIRQSRTKKLNKIKFDSVNGRSKSGLVTNTFNTNENQDSFNKILNLINGSEENHEVIIKSSINNDYTGISKLNLLDKGSANSNVNNQTRIIKRNYAKEDIDRKFKGGPLLVKRNEVQSKKNDSNNPRQQFTVRRNRPDSNSIIRRVNSDIEIYKKYR